MCECFILAQVYMNMCVLIVGIGVCEIGCHTPETTPTRPDDHISLASDRLHLTSTLLPKRIITPLHHDPQMDHCVFLQRFYYERQSLVLYPSRTLSFFWVPTHTLTSCVFPGRVCHVTSVVTPG